MTHPDGSTKRLPPERIAEIRHCLSWLPVADELLHHIDAIELELADERQHVRDETLAHVSTQLELDTAKGVIARLVDCDELHCGKDYCVRGSCGCACGDCMLAKNL